MGVVEAYENQVRSALFVSDPAVLYEYANRELKELLMPETDVRANVQRGEYAWALRGRPLPGTDIDAVRQFYLGEAGDVLYCLAASGMLPGQDQVSPGAILTRTNLLLGGEELADLSIVSDTASSAIEPAVPEGFVPNYFEKHGADWLPIGGGTADSWRDGVNFWDRPVAVPIRFSGDGYYALTHVVQEGVESIGCHTPGEKAHVDAIALAVGVIAAIGVSRLGVTLEEIIEHNLEKVSRRQKQGTLEHGADRERSRKLNEPLETVHAGLLTLNALFHDAVTAPRTNAATESL